MSLLADCFIKLMTDNILPNARSVKGNQNLTLLYLHLNIHNNVRSLCSCQLWCKNNFMYKAEGYTTQYNTQ